MKKNKNKCQAGRDNAQPNAIKEVGRFMLDTLEFVLAVIAIVGIIYLYLQPVQSQSFSGQD